MDGIGQEVQQEELEVFVRLLGVFRIVECKVVQDEQQVILDVFELFVGRRVDHVIGSL